MIITEGKYFKNPQMCTYICVQKYAILYYPLDGLRNSVQNPNSDSW